MEEISGCHQKIASHASRGSRPGTQQGKDSEEASGSKIGVKKLCRWSSFRKGMKVGVNQMDTLPQAARKWGQVI